MRTLSSKSMKFKNDRGRERENIQFMHVFGLYDEDTKDVCFQTARDRFHSKFSPLLNPMFIISLQSIRTSWPQT